MVAQSAPILSRWSLVRRCDAGCVQANRRLCAGTRARLCAGSVVAMVRSDVRLSEPAVGYGRVASQSMRTKGFPRGFVVAIVAALACVG